MNRDLAKPTIQADGNQFGCMHCWDGGGNIASTDEPLHDW